MRICPAIHPRADIDPGYFASPVPLPLTRTLDACLGRFNDPKRANYNPAYKWGDDDPLVGHKGNDFGVKGDITAMADGKVAHVDRTDNDAAGVWVATLHKCPECPGWFLFRHLHLRANSVPVMVGQPVGKGQRLGAIGPTTLDLTGNAHWLHTHTDLRHSSSPTANQAGSFGPTWGIPYDPQAWRLAWPVTVPVPPTLVHLEVDRPLLRPGATGRGVEELQALLNVLDFSLSEDGLYGATTVAAVKVFQAKMNLAADGVVGRLTWNALLDF